MKFFIEYVMKAFPSSFYSQLQRKLWLIAPLCPHTMTPSAYIGPTVADSTHGGLNPYLQIYTALFAHTF